MSVVQYKKYFWLVDTIRSAGSGESDKRCALYLRQPRHHSGCTELQYQQCTVADQENDRAVMAAYSFSTKMSESECVAKLFELYQKLTK